MHLTLHLTTACNMRCAYCYAPPVQGPVMTRDTALAALELAIRSSRDETPGIAFFGGEPLLHGELVRDVVLEGRRLQREGHGRVHFKLTTNGLLLDDEFLDFAVRNDVFIAISLDGTAAAHDAHRRLRSGAASHGTVLERLRSLLRVKPYSTVLMVVSPQTVQHYAASVRALVEGEGVRYLVVSLEFSGAWTESHLEVLGAQIDRVSELYLRWSREGRKFYLSPWETRMATHVAGPEAAEDHCHLGLRQLSVDPAGQLYPCVQFTRAGRDWRIGDVWRGVDEELRLRLQLRSDAVKQPCDQCALESRCHNTCGCLNYQTTGTVTEVSPVLCRYEQLMIPEADRVAEVLFAEGNRLFLNKHYNRTWPLLSLLEDVAGST